MESLDRYLREHASQDARKRAAAPFVLVTEENQIAGYYTLSATLILAANLPAKTIKKLKWPRYPELPATLIGRLARDVRFRGQGIGELLLLDAFERALNSEIASIAVVVDSKDERAARFYGGFGFVPLLETPNRLYLPMKTIEELYKRGK